VVVGYSLLYAGQINGDNTASTRINTECVDSYLRRNTPPRLSNLLKYLKYWIKYTAAAKARSDFIVSGRRLYDA